MRSFNKLILSLGLTCSLCVPSLSFASDSHSDDLVKRGKYLVEFGGCNDCHTPKIFTKQGPRPNLKKLLSGYQASGKLPKLPNGVLGPKKWGAITNNDLTAWVGPWGVSFAANLTPDKKTGLGNWTAETFIQAMRSGKHQGNGRNILPPMPWFSLAALSDDDLKAIFSFLQSIPAVNNKVPQPKPPKM